MALTLRGRLSIAMVVASSVLLAVEARDVEMLVIPEKEIHQSVYRMLSDRGETNENTTTTQETATKVEATTFVPTTSEAIVTKAKATTSEASTSDAMTTSVEEDVAPQPKAIITGTASMSVANATDFCANDAALEVIENVMKKETGATEVEVDCEASARRLSEGLSRRLQESVTLAYTITIEADAVNGGDSSFSESSPEVLNVMNKLEALDATTLQTLIQEDLAAANIDVEVTVLDVTAPQVQIEFPTTTFVAGLVRVPTDASSRLSVGAYGLFVATVLSFALHL